MDSTHLVSLFEHATEGIVLTQGRGGVIMLNPAALKMFGYENASEIIGNPIEILIPSRYRKNHAAYREDFNHHPQNRVMGNGRDLFGQKKSGLEFPVEVSLSFYFKGEILYIIAFIVDITERKRNETARSEIQEALEKEKQLNEIKSRFMSIASHEFRTPLSTILSSATLLSKYVNTEDHSRRERHVDRIKNAVHSLNNILEDFLSLGRLEEGKISINLTEFDISELILTLIEEMNSLLKGGQQITVKQKGDDFVITDKRILKNIMTNLLTNAIKFSPDGASIKIYIDNSTAGLKIEVADEGIGVPADEIENLFSSFYRARNAVNIQGTGLGLHIIKRYLKLLGGDIHIDTVLDQGSSFNITIPCKHL